MKSSAKLIGNLVHRVASRLPYKSGRTIESVEKDPIVRQTVAAIIEVSKYKLGIVANTLGYVLESVSKTHQIYERNVPVEIMQSKLFVLRLLSNCMQSHRQHCKEQEKMNNVDIPITELNLELPALDAALVSFTLVLMSRYITQYHLIEEHNSDVANSQRIYDFNEEDTGYTYEEIKLSLISDIYKQSSNIIYYVSSTNWDSCYSKIKNAVLYLDSSTSIDDIPPEIRMLEGSSLNRARLITIFRELTPYYKRMGERAQILYAKMLRKAIWKWIETYPSEFTEVSLSSTQLITGSEALFDACNSSADNSRKRAVLWPLQTLLLILTPDNLVQVSSSSPSLSNRRSNFLVLLKKSLKTTRTTDISTVCYVDLCKAATYVPPDDRSLLRSIAVEVGHDLKQKIWDLSKAPTPESTLVMLGYTVDHECLITDFIITQLHLHPHETLAELIPPAIEENVPILFKLSFIKAVLAIITEETPLSWNPTADTMYDQIGGLLRKLFLQTIRMDMIPRKNKAFRKDMNNTATTNHSSRVELLVHMLQLFALNPSLALLGSDDDRLEQNCAFMTGLASLFQHPVYIIRHNAQELLLKMTEDTYIAQYGTHLMPSFWKVSSQMIYTLARQILENKNNEDNIRAVLALIIKLLTARNTFLKSKVVMVNEGSHIRERVQACIALEVSLLVCLCYVNKDISDDALKCIDLLCTEAQIADVDENGEVNSFAFHNNLPVYHELASENSPFLGRKAQQKRIRKYLRRLPYHSIGNMTAWEEAWRRWKQLNMTIARLSEEYVDDFPNDGHLQIQSGSSITVASTNSSTSPPVKKSMLTGRTEKVRTTIIKAPRSLESFEEVAAEWQNYTGFLAALGGCCLVESNIDNFDIESKISWTSADSRRISTTNEPTALVNKFVKEMIDMLVSDNVYIREGMKDTLGSDLSPALYSILFQHLEMYMARCFDVHGEAIRNPANKLFVEQTVLVLRLILDRLVEPGSCLLNIDFSTLIGQFANYLHRLPVTYITLRIKVKMCLLIKTVMSKKDHIVIRDEMRLRNRLMDTIMEWTSDFAMKKKILETGQHMDRLQKELDQACLKAIVSLLQQLPLQPLEPVRPSEISLVKSQLFLKYFNFFRKLLDKYKQSEKDLKNMNGFQLSSSSRSFVSLQNEIYQDWAQMKELTIMAMSHLLSANVDAGLKYSLSMGYDEDQETRTAFMQVLTNILHQGAEFETLAENVMIDRYEKLIDMLVEADMAIVMSLCEVCPSADTIGLAEVLLTAFDSRCKVDVLLKAVVQREVSLTEQETTLFRGTTIATRILSIFAKLSCLDYIRLTLQPALEEINALPNDQLTWELDPQKLENGGDLMKNKENVIRATEILLKAICSSVESAPRVFREELHLIREAVDARFPEAKSTAVGGFVFLRLFGPAILTPENAGFSKQTIPRPNTRKLILQATRVMQNLANNVLFGSKETHMILLNDFLTMNIYRVTNFLRNISTVPEETPKEEVGTVSMDQSSYVSLHKYLSDNLERMSRDLTGRKGKEQGTEAVMVRKRTLEKLSTLLAQLGRPSEMSQSEFSYKSYSSVFGSQYYSDFMRRNSHRDFSHISSKNLFYMGGNSKEGRPIFYLVCRYMDTEDIDFELMTYYMLRVLEPHLNKPFEILYDTTQLSSTRAIPTQWLCQFLQLIFSESSDFLVSIHIYNPNIYLQGYIRKLPRALMNKIVKRTHFSSNINDLCEHMAPSEVRLPKETLDLEKEISVTIFPVTRISNLKLSIPVTVKIGPEHMQVITMKKQEVMFNLNTVLRDVYHMSDLEDMVALPCSKPENGGEISIKYDRGKSTMILFSPKRDLLLAHLLRSKQRYETSKPNTINERAIRPNDVPGRLLNISLLNIGSTIPSLRLAAYNLLYSLSLSFRFNIGNQLLNAKDLCIPANSTDFIVGISETLAQSEVHLTLEFLNEAFIGLNKSNESMRQLCLNYMVPWLKNLGAYSRLFPEENKRNALKIKDVIRLLIDLTIRRPELYKYIQDKVWKTLAEIDDLAGLLIECFVQYSMENSIGSLQSEVVADTLVTMSTVSIRGKIISRTRRVLENTSLQPCRHLVEHPYWNEIVILLRFNLMLSFNNNGPVVSYLPEVFHIVSILMSTGSTFIRSSVHELVVNTIHSLCTLGVTPMGDNMKKLRFVLSDVSDSKNRVSFGLTKQHANAFTITNETINDKAEPVNLNSLQNVVYILMDALNYGAPSPDIANMWRARWMSLVTSTAFYFNPAIQPRSFVTLGCLAQDEIDDDLLYQILVALKGALAIFNETDSTLIVSIIMCLTNIINNLPTDSRYLLQLFWLAVALVQVGHQGIFEAAVKLLHAVLKALDARQLFTHYYIQEVLFESRKNLGPICTELDDACGVNFDDYFSFSIATILLRGLKQCETKDVIYQCLSAFLEIDSKRTIEQGLVESRALGYLAGLLPFATKEEILRELLRLAGVNDIELKEIDFGGSHSGLFDLIEIPDNSTALLLVSLLVTLLNASENEGEKLFLYTLLADAAVCVPEVFSMVYESLLPKMNHMVVNSLNHDVIDAIKNILITACSEPALFIPLGATGSSAKRTQKYGLDNLRFPALGDPTFGAMKTNISVNAKLASKLLGNITDQQH
ncbi:hypothetical protein BDB01DRAFT_807208 [Pilobolus umbonatus]|nr:hypothetical protein BDB01DRAFT_807208 [Pilobolus umbonatus]